VFSVIWGICFSLKANPNGIKTSDTVTLLAEGTRLRDTAAGWVASGSYDIVIILGTQLAFS